MSLRSFYNLCISPQRWLERAGIRAQTQIVIGLVLLTASVMLFAEVLRLFPHEHDALLKERFVISEMAALQAAHSISYQDYTVTREILAEIVDRYSDVLSVSMRRLDGTVIIQTPGHVTHWSAAANYESTPTHVKVPLSDHGKPWGQLQICFKPLPQAELLIDWLSKPGVRLTTFVLASVSLLFSIYMSRMLKMLDPSAAIPHRLQLLFDTLVEGIVILDERDQIVMANQSFAQTAFSSMERLIGTQLSTLPWQMAEGDISPEAYPWKAVRQNSLHQRGIPMKLQIGTRHTRVLNVNASPILGPDGRHRGVIVTFNDQTVIAADNLQLAQFVSRFNEEIKELQGRLPSTISFDPFARLEELARNALELVEVSNAVSSSENGSTTAISRYSKPGQELSGAIDNAEGP